MPKVRTPPTVTVQMRMAPAEKRDFTAAAKALGLSLSAWVRMLAHKEIEDARRRSG